MAKSTTTAAVAFLLLFSSLFLLSHAATTTTSTEDATKPDATIEVLPATVSVTPLTKAVLEPSYIPIRIDHLPIDGPLRELKGGRNRHPIHVRFFHTHRPLRLVNGGRYGMPPEWRVGFGGRRMGMGFRFHRGHVVRCGFMKRMMELEGKEGFRTMMRDHHHHLHHGHHHEQHHDGEKKKEGGGGLMKWVQGLLEQF